MSKHYSNIGTIVNTVHSNSGGRSVVHVPLYEANSATEAAAIANLLNTETFNAREEFKTQLFAFIDLKQTEHRNAPGKEKLDS